jgi:succinyl-diaminopimelate desuccinylase
VAKTVLNLEQDVVELTRQICDIESVSGNETELADAIEQALRAYPHLEIIRDADAIIARTNLGRLSRVVIAGHIDTVPLASNLPVEDRIIDGQASLWGRGTVDMKAGVAVQLKLAATVTEPTVDLTFIYYDHEEVDASLNGLGRISRNHPDLLSADFAILCEPTSALVEGGCNGTLRAELTASGVKAHSARPWMGSHAIPSLSEALSRLAAYEPAEVEVDGLVYRESLNAVLVSGGIATNVIPDRASITVNYRYAPNQTHQTAEAHLRDLFAGLPIELTVTDFADGARPGLDLPAAKNFVAATGREARPKYGWTDVARFSALGIPAVNFGPGDPNKAHADDEHCPKEQIYFCESALLKWLS